MTPKTKKILIGTGIALVVTLAVIGGIKLYKKMTDTRSIDVTLLTPEQRKKLQTQGVTIPSTGSIPVKASELNEVQIAKIVAGGRG